MTNTMTITCNCKTHADGARSAKLTGPVAEAFAKRTGRDRAERLHGLVTLANHPAKMMRIANARKGIEAA